MILLVTVGSTSFDELIEVMNSSFVLDFLSSQGFKKIIYQIGKGTFIPHENKMLEVQWFRFTDDLLTLIKDSNLIVGHAGAGTVLESLYSNEPKPLIVVMNENLMNNHQRELAEKLSSDGYLKCCTCSSVLQTMKHWFGDNLKRKSFISQSGIFAPVLESILGIK